ncbi:hypothetical protein EMIT0194P_80059 [Pseudomonas serbica]
MTAVILVAGTVDIAVDVEGIDVAVGGERGLVLVVQHDLGLGHRTQAEGRQAGNQGRQKTLREVLIVVHGALRDWDELSEAIIESSRAAPYAALGVESRCFGMAARARQLWRKTVCRQGSPLRV